jgi:predicted DNA-binding transcriptional regulator YafY
MAGKLSYERYLWFHSRLKAGKYPKLSDLSEKFEISQRQASREIEFMRLFFNAPIEYSNDETGYFYSDNKFELPGIWASEEEIVTLIIAKRLASTIPHKKRKKKFDTFIKKFLSDTGIDISTLEKKISIKNIRFYKVDPMVFETVVLGLSNGMKLKIHYSSPYKDDPGIRIVSPIHLLLYMGNWHLFAYCDEKKEIRDFVLSRISDSEITKTAIPEKLKKKDLRKKVYENYGIFLEGEKTEVALKFTSNTAKVAREQIWFLNQVVEESGNGEITIKFPVSDFREVLKDILALGPGVEVISPPELRGMVTDTISNMRTLYKI